LIFIAKSSKSYTTKHIQENSMLNHVGKQLLLGMVLTISAISVNALTITDTKDYSNAESGEYFFGPDEDLASSPNVRLANSRWLWQQDAMDLSELGDDYAATLTITSHVRTIGTEPYGLNSIFAYTGNQWLSLGILDGENESWATTTFELPDAAWVREQAQSGIYFYVDISTSGEASNALALASSVLTLTSGTASEVSEPGTLALFGLSLLGFGIAQRRKVRTSSAKI